MEKVALGYNIVNMYVNFLFIIAFFGILINRRNLILILICFEMMLVTLCLKFVYFATIYNDSFGYFMMIVILTMAAAETAIGLSLIVSYFKFKGNISVKKMEMLSK